MCGPSYLPRSALDGIRRNFVQEPTHPARQLPDLIVPDMRIRFSEVAEGDFRGVARK